MKIADNEIKNTKKKSSGKCNIRVTGLNSRSREMSKPIEKMIADFIRENIDKFPGYSKDELKGILLQMAGDLEKHGRDEKDTKKVLVDEDRFILKVRKMSEKKYKKAWKEFVGGFGGALDGVEFAAGHGSSQAVKDSKIYQEVKEMINEVAEKYNVEEVWFR